jgi:hemolysin activation/secretion protein
MTIKLKRAVSLIALMSASLAQAQQLPTAGNLLRDLESQPKLGAPKEDAPVATPSGPASSSLDASSARARVDKALVTGSTVFTAQELEKVASVGLGREMSLAEIEALAERVTRHYRSRGYTLARAYLPAQDIEGGVVRIEVLEGRYGQIKVEDQSKTLRSKPPLGALRSGDVVTDQALERGLLLLRDLPGVDATSTIQPGAQAGTSDLVVEVIQTARVDGAVQWDNSGNRSSGKNRVGGFVNLNNPLGLGDQLSFAGLGAQSNLAYGRLAYQLPVGSQGAIAGVSWSSMHYELGGEFAALDANGAAKTSGASLTYPIARSRSFNLNASLAFDHKSLSDRVDRVGSATDKSAKAWTASLAGDARDSFHGGGAWAFSAAYSRGRLGLDSFEAQYIDQLTARSEGGYGKIALNGARIQSLWSGGALYASYAGQWASKNLDSSEKFSLGGVSGVRAYPQGEAPADQAHLATLELRQAFDERWQAFAFVDVARAQLNKSTWAGFAGANRRSLAGAGVGALWSFGGYTAKIQWAKPIGGDFSAVDASRSGRFWAQAGKSF